MGSMFLVGETMSQKKDAAEHPPAAVELIQQGTSSTTSDNEDSDHLPCWLERCTTYEKIFENEQKNHRPGGQLRRVEWGLIRAVALKQNGAAGADQQHKDDYLALRMAVDTLDNNITELSTMNPNEYERYERAMMELREKIKEWINQQV